jgi:hypothetical protein
MSMPWPGATSGSSGSGSRGCGGGSCSGSGSGGGGSGGGGSGSGGSGSGGSGITLKAAARKYIQLQRSSRHFGSPEAVQAAQVSPVASLLFQNALSVYVAVFDEEGYDNLVDLKQWARDENEEWRMLLMRSKMKPVHKRKLRSALGVGPDAADAADAADIAEAHRSAENAGSATSAESSIALDQEADKTEQAKEVGARDEAERREAAEKPGRRTSLMPDAIQVTEERVAAAPRGGVTKKKNDADIRDVIQQLLVLAQDHLERQVDSAELAVSFADEEAGEIQKFIMYNEAKSLLVMASLTTQTKARGRFYGTNRCVQATGYVRCCDGITAEGKAELQGIANLTSISKKTYDTETLISKGLLPNLPSADFIVVLKRQADFQRVVKMSGSTQVAVEAYCSSIREHQKVLDTFEIHGADRFTESTVYRVHPNLQLRKFIPIGDYDQLVFEAKRAEFFKIARQLCAKSISVDKEDDEAQRANVSASADVQGVGLSQSAAMRKQKHNSQSMDQTFAKPADLTPKFDSSGTYFHAAEETWKSMVKGRMDAKGAKLQEFCCKFKYESGQNKSAKLKLGLPGIAGLDVGGENEEHISIDESVKVSASCLVLHATQSQSNFRLPHRFTSGSEQHTALEAQP